MHSSRPKVLHPIAHQSMLAHVYDCAMQLSPHAVHIIYGHGGEQVKAHLSELNANWVEQAEQLGTGHAVAQAMPAVDDNDTVLVLYGDVPLTKAATLSSLVDAAEGKALGLLTVALEHPAGYGRIVRDAQDHVTCIVEEKDASEIQKQINEVNTGMLAVSAKLLKGWLAKLDNRNAQGEYYLTDIIAMAVADGVPVNTVMPEDATEVMGVNDRVQLAQLEREFQMRQAESLLRQGVSLRDPARFDVRGDVSAGQDVSIDINVVLEGKVVIGDRVSIGANVVIKDAVIGNDVCIEPMCVIEDAQIGNAVSIGPFARIRPATVLKDRAKVGNFVEIKKATIGEGSKVNHLSYVGDTTMGSNVNVGAGTITCNYDGANKHQTIIGDNVFIGSDTQLVAPVTIGDGATIGAGSTITKDTPAGELTLSRSKQMTRAGWKRPVKK